VLGNTAHKLCFSQNKNTLIFIIDLWTFYYST